jgi:hypothetical protein
VEVIDTARKQVWVSALIPGVGADTYDGVRVQVPQVSRMRIAILRSGWENEAKSIAL